MPRLAVEWLREHPDRRHLAVDGSLAFVDMSGFTTLTERLARAGRVGSEEVNDILDEAFGSLLTEARGDGADLVKWAGDAVLLLFRGPDHAARAARATYRMRRRLRVVGQATASAGRVTLRMSVGIHSGRFDLFLVGDPEVHRELIVAGPGATATAEMESVATSGQIVVSEATAALLHPASVGAPTGSGWLLRSAPLLADLEVSDLDQDVDVRGLLPPPVRRHLQAAAGGSEHRPIAVAFVEFSGTDEVLAEGGDSAATDALDECVRNVQHACAAHGVSFLESDIGRSGGKIMLAAGAPRSTGDDDERLLRAVQVAVSRAGRLGLRAGINHGPVFAGDFGPPFRRTYSITGDAINLAARVTAHAPPGSVLATTEVLARSRTRFARTPVEPFLVKGKARPVDAAVLGTPEAAPADAGGGDPDEGPFVGRDAELATARGALERAGSGRGTVLEIVAEPGMGKTRLVQEIRRPAGTAVVSAPSSSYESSTPYHSFRLLLHRLLGVVSHPGEPDTADRLTELVRDGAPQLLPWLPLVGVVLDVPVPATRESAELDAAVRHERLQDTLVELLVHLFRQPTLLVFENVHLMDDASAELLGRLADRVATLPWVLLVTRREVATGYLPDRSAGSVESLVLEPISAALSRSLLDAASRDTPLSPHTAELLAAKAGGNPLFLKALVAAAGHAGGAAELPDSVEAVLTNEIDRLEPRDRTVLRCAAVLGMRFADTLLDELLVAGEIVGTDLSRLSEFLQPDGAGVWRFRHALVREAAYAGLPYRVRRSMHAHAGRVLEADPANVAERPELLSLHFFHSNSHERAWTYSRIAGQRAQAQYAYTGAIEFYERALESGRESSVAATELAEVVEALGDVCDIAGFSAEAVRNYRRGRPYRRDEPLGRARLMLKEAGVQQRRGAFVTSLRLLAHARRLLRDLPGAEAESARSRLATRCAFGSYLQGRHAAAARWSEIGVREARASGDRDALAYAYNTRHLACIHAGIAEEEPYGELALAAYRELGDLRMQAHCLNNLAISALQEGRWASSAEHLDQAVALFKRIGDTANEANTLYNRADLLIRQRRFTEAAAPLDAAGRAARAAGDRELVALVARETGRVHAGLGDFAAALDRFDAARAGLAELDLAQELVALDGALAESLANAGAVDQALDVVAEAVGRAQRSGPESELAALHRIHGTVLAAAGCYADAAAAFEAGLRSPDSGDGGRERALNLLGLASLADHRAVPDAAGLAAQGTEILAALGVLSPEPVPQT